MFEHHFIVRGKDVIGHARHYLGGLLGRQRRKNIECIGAHFGGSDYQGMQQFISDSPWSHEALMRQIGEEADRELGGDDESALVLDESSFVKKGDLSVGVQRQYCGRLGKTENCQVGVFACLGRGSRAALVDMRLFLPESWAQDEQRCKKAKVPDDKQKHHTKTELALQMVEAARERGSRHAWVGGDEVYGNNQVFCAQLEDLGERFLMDVAHVTKVWTSDPRPGIVQPRSTPKGGRPRRSVQAGNAQAEQKKLSALVAQCFEKESREVKLRESTQGELRAPIMVRSVWLWDGKTEKARQRLLVVRKEADGSFKYSLGNLPADTSWEKLALMQAQRFWIEQAFKEAKGELGMAQYEVRGWAGWHHHMAMVSLAQLFTVKEKQRLARNVPLLSVRDITELLDIYLPRRERSEKEVLRQMAQRHSNRAQSSKSHSKARKKRRLTSLKT